jgi:hypothetical protein
MLSALRSTLSTLRSLLYALSSLLIFSILAVPSASAQLSSYDVSLVDRVRTIKSADKYLHEEPITITASSSPRSSGGKHDYFSEGDYWWPDTLHPDGPYVQRDGMTNPSNFVAHREAMIRFGVQVGTLTSAWLYTGYPCYAEHAVRHLKAWFVDTTTRMNPHLLYAQAIKGKVTGRGTGIIDTIHLIEIALSIPYLEQSGALSQQDALAIRQWFKDYLKWMTTHPYGIEEENAKNNHGASWVFQAAAFARLTGDTAVLSLCRERYRTILLPDQMGGDGSFPLELKRTKPYGYSLFNCEIMSGICQILSDGKDDLWGFALPDGRSMKKGMEYITPFISDKSTWPYKPDVMYFDNWPVRQSALLFAGNAYNNSGWLGLWKKLDPAPTVPEVVRNFPVRNPILWLHDVQPPRALALLDPWSLTVLHHDYASGKLRDNDVINKLLKGASKLLKRTPPSVMEKTELPPSGNRHDYMSVAPYWWPDTSKPEGTPYIRMDGKRNPEREKMGDRTRIGDMMKSVTTLGLAYAISGDKRFAVKGADYLRVWFCDTATRMNPNLDYAQSIRGREDGRGAGIIDSYGFAEMMDAVTLLPLDSIWEPRQIAVLRGWFTDYLHWLRTSRNGVDESNAKNNHGTVYDVQTSSIAIFLGKFDEAAQIIGGIPAKHIDIQLKPDGTEPLELARTKSWGYSNLNLNGLVRGALIGSRLGIDFWNYTSPGGGSLRRSIDWLLPYATGEKSWDYTQIVPMEKSVFYPTLRIAAWKYGDTKYVEALGKIPDVDEKSELYDFLFTDTANR